MNKNDLKIIEITTWIIFCIFVVLVSFIVVYLQFPPVRVNTRTLTDYFITKEIVEVPVIEYKIEPYFINRTIEVEKIVYREMDISGARRKVMDNVRDCYKKYPLFDDGIKKIIIEEYTSHNVTGYILVKEFNNIYKERKHNFVYFLKNDTYYCEV